MLLALILWLGTAEVTLPNGLTTHYADSGKGEAIVLISGLASRLQSWDAVVPLLEPHFRVIRPDNRGVGDSGDLEGAYSVDTMAEDVALLMAALEIEHYNVAGLSLGSFAVQALALQHPDRVKHLILIGSSPGGTAHVPPEAEVLALFQTLFTVPAQDRPKQGQALNSERTNSRCDGVEPCLCFSTGQRNSLHGLYSSPQIDLCQPLASRPNAGHQPQRRSF